MSLPAGVIHASRRSFLRAGLFGAGSLLCNGAPLLGAFQEPPVPGKERMIVRSRRYLDLETPAHLLDSWITPVDLFYVRNHLAQPRVNLAEWRLAVTGEVERPLELTLAELEAMPAHTVVNTLECAGNGRSFHRPRVAGIQWTRGAVGTARFAGPRLADVLRRAGVKPSGRHVMFDGMDAPSGNVPDFIRSIPVERALHPDTLLATRMNGAPLTLEHGYPARALVPGWLGAASVKWLVEIRVLEKEFDGNFMKPGYRMPRRPVQPGAAVSADEMDVITALPVKSIIASPGDGATVRRGPLRVMGAAWAGEHDIAAVEVSADGGVTWRAATLGREQAKYAWRIWEYAWTPPGTGAHEVISRATDTAGRTQPLEPAWNPSGYLWNAADRVRVHVEG